MRTSFGRRMSVALATCAVTVVTISSADVLTQLDVTAASAKEAVKQAVASGWFDYGPARRAFKAASPALRADMTEGMMAWARTFVATPEFKSAYQAARQNRKPKAPAFEGTPEQEFQRQREEQKAEQARSAEGMKAALAQMPADQRKQIEETMKSTAELMAQMDTPEMRKMILDGIRMERVRKQQEYQEAVAKWQQEYPEDVNAAVARRLASFLEQTADIAFDAKLTACGDKMCFADQQYERKSGNWKIAYRAGREPVTRARAAARAWLSSIEGK